MQVEAIYNNGKLEGPKSIRFVRKRFKVKVDIPEQEFADMQPFGIQEPLSHESLKWLRMLQELREEVINTREDQLPKVTTEEIERLEAAKMRFLLTPNS